jgi:hypothetical protein
MKTRTLKKLATLATAATITLGSGVAAHAANIQQRGTDGGNITCSSTKRITITVSSPGGHVYVFAGGEVLYDQVMMAGTRTFRATSAYAGAWTVSGAMNSASASCT